MEFSETIPCVAELLARLLFINQPMVDFKKHNAGAERSLETQRTALRRSTLEPRLHVNVEILVLCCNKSLVKIF